MTFGRSSSSRVHRLVLFGGGLALAAVGVFLTVGGIMLATLGGSLYFLFAGGFLAVAGALIARGNRKGAWLYGIVLAGTVAWAVVDAGIEFWPLVSRLYAPLVAGLAVGCAYPIVHPGLKSRIYYAIIIALAGPVILMTLGALQVHGAVPGEPTPLLARTGGRPQVEWIHWGNDPGGRRFAGLAQINRSNVNRLSPAWTFRSGFPPVGWDTHDQNTPLQAGELLFICTATAQVLAVNIDTGREQWRFDPHDSAPGRRRCRGLGYYRKAAPRTATLPAATRLCAERLFVPTADARLIALDAKTGRRCPDFGSKGTIDMKVGMGEVAPGAYQQTSAPLVAADLVIIGGRVAEEEAKGLPPGVVRAFDAVSGALVWALDPGNPSVTRLPPANGSYSRGTPNVWSAMSYDPANRLVYAPFANANPDFWGGDRTPGDEKFGSALVAIDVASGRPRWIFQAVHHDVWDYDLAAQPVLVDLQRGNEITPAVALTTKHGEIFLLHRLTGEPLSPVRERPVPQVRMRGERHALTQPFSVGMPSIGADHLRESDMWGLTPLDQLACRIKLRRLRYDGRFTALGADRSLQYPGSLGGMNWGSASIDPASSTMFVTDTRLGMINRLHPVRLTPRQRKAGFPPYLRERMQFLSPLGLPCQKPPYGTVSAIDLRTGRLRWQVPAGTVQYGRGRLKLSLPFPIGLPTLGPSLVTSGGVLFFAGTQDPFLRAYDTSTGRELWKGRLPLASQGGPITYVSPRTGRQYVVVTAGGAAASFDRGDYLVAFALPQRDTARTNSPARNGQDE